MNYLIPIHITAVTSYGQREPEPPSPEIFENLSVGPKG
jgi:hypothetical protein